MENKDLVRQMVDLHKTSFDNSFNMLITMQDQMEKMVNSFVEKAPWLPEEGKNAVTNLVSTYKKGREDFAPFFYFRVVKLRVCMLCGKYK